MSNTKVISVRVDESLLSKIDEAVSNSPYMTRNDLVCGLLRFSLEFSKKYRLKKIAGFYPDYGDIVDSMEFDYHREHH